ncbi:DUF2905 domain-containing protein [Thermoanaerobacterium sp. DL9XJH110]|jgi:hypothetical protein|uniref:DUF2905 domain-containing protein n=1 Tax=Thermoanaerobacterium sp. DL9XJH110 TaxID=3386643 RepID=UPI003BB5DF94
MLNSFGKILIMMGVFLIAIGGIFLLGSNIGIGRLPGDIVVKKGNFTFYFPLATSIILSIILTVIFSLFRR